ncbi:MAG: alpha/beta hydrolase fold domain-containing protein [Acidobacteriota bacterium]|nr:alpha/beta hydrolase fold domain-containing protein [Acidobacteriota bacterium]
MEPIVTGRRAVITVALAETLLSLAPTGLAQPAQSVPQTDSCTMDADGTAHVTRVVPVPATISPEARRFISRPGPSGPPPPLAKQRAETDAFRIGRAAEARKLFPVRVEARTIGGVRCDVITPLKMPSKPDCVLINVHGGGFVTDSGSLVEGVPIAFLTRIPVISVYYRLAPEHPFPAAVDDTVAVYREVLKTHKPQNVGLFGTSAGAILTAEVASALRRDGMPLPGALGVFSGTGDMSQPGDAQALYTIWGFSGHLRPPPKKPILDPYVGKTNPKDPVLSPVYADLHGFPPGLFVTSTRDLLLSGTSILHRAFLRAGAPAEIVVFEALPHAFWYNYELPETREALNLMAAFFERRVGG